MYETDMLEIHDVQETLTDIYNQTHHTSVNEMDLC